MESLTFENDFLQTLSVVRKHTKEDIVGGCLQRSYLWRHVEVLYLAQNMYMCGSK